MIALAVILIKALGIHRLIPESLFLRIIFLFPLSRIQHDIVGSRNTIDYSARIEFLDGNISVKHRIPCLVGDTKTTVAENLTDDIASVS